MQFLPMAILLVFFAVMMFMTSRNQKKQQQEKLKKLDEMRPGDEIITIGGLHGLLHEVDRNSNTVTLDCEGVLLVFETSAIRTINAVKTTENN